MGIDRQDSMKVRLQQFARGFWDLDHHHHHHYHNSHNSSHCKSISTSTVAAAGTTTKEYEPSLSLGCKRLRPLAPKLSAGRVDLPAADRLITAFDLKSFIRPDSGPIKLSPSTVDEKTCLPQVLETHPGGTRWNPTQEQIGILEMLYRQGMRTPNAQQIEQITARLSEYGKIEGKNVFYWFQNHKARERQKQKRNVLGVSHNRRTPAPTCRNITPSITLNSDNKGEAGREEQTASKRKCGRWSFECCLSEENFETMITSLSSPQLGQAQGEGDKKTLELFPLHPEDRS